MLLGIIILYATDWPGRQLLRRRRAGWRRRLESVTLGDPGEPVALPSGVIGRLRAAVELAGRIESLLVREGGQPVGLAALLAFGRKLPFWPLIFDCCHLPAGGSRLHGLALVVVRLLSLTRLTSQGPRSLRGHLA